MTSDHRVYGALKRLSEARKVYIVLSVKGGVGKTTLSTLLALSASAEQACAGLLDLDFVNPSTHLFLGLDPGRIRYEEERGLNPLRLGNLLYFTIAPYTQGLPLPLHGKGARDLLWEVLSIVNWKGVEVLIADTPPGLGDEHLELLYRLRTVVTPVVVTTPSRLSLNSTLSLLDLLKEIGYEKVYLVENMGTQTMKDIAESRGVIHAGSVPFIAELESSIGKIEELKILSTRVANILRVLKESS